MGTRRWRLRVGSLAGVREVKTERDVVNLAMELKARDFIFLPAQRVEIEELEGLAREMGKRADHVATLRLDLRRGHTSWGETDMAKCARMLMAAEANLVPMKESVAVAARSVALHQA